jgi:pimeloyl-ACP methyl ester carboxylesterase
MALPRLPSHVQPLFEHRLEFAGFDTRVLELEGDGPGLVLLHGWGDSADTWRPLLAELGARDRRAIAVDLPAFGTAARLRDGAMLPQYNAVAADLARPRAAEAAVVGAFATHHASRARVAALLESGRRLLPELSTSPFDFERIRCPVLLVWGTRDRTVPHTGARILLELLLPFPAGVRV